MPTVASDPRTGTLLEANLAALSRRSPRVADAVRRATPRHDLVWTATDQEGAWSASLDGRWLASRRRPVEEGERLAASVDFKNAGAAVVLGLGVGYHVAALARRAGNHSVVLVFEPDVSLLRAVLEHADLAPWLREGRAYFFTDPEDGAALTEALSGLEAILGLGVSIVEHPASRARLAGAGARFGETLARVVAAARTQIVTTMTQMEVTIRNMLMNVGHYCGGAGIEDLKNAAKGRAAVVVAAGPSLERNLRLLAAPGVRERYVIVAVQTVLKPMLALGIKPHFVTALDFHEISRRFYEGLRREDVEGVTLIAEAKANAAILDAFPGAIRMPAAETLDVLLGPDLARRHGPISPGATVAHLAYYVARHLGCDPVILIGQDLAFTDGQYYAAGAAIHDVWATELNPFRTLEMMEWERIVRWRGHLHRVTDHLGRSVYTDDQMSTYQAQFEREFLADRERGLTTIDATEGGSHKAHTSVMPLREALERSRPAGAWSLPVTPSAVHDASRPALRARLSTVRRDAATIASLSRDAATLLREMRDSVGRTERVNRLIDKVYALRERVQALEPAYNLVHRLNQAGAFKRFRADRSLGLDEALDPLERQKGQIERDLMNVSWLADAADTIEDLLGATLSMLEGGAKRTRDPVIESAAARVAGGGLATRRARVAAVLPVDPERSALGVPRSLTDTIVGVPLLHATLERLARCRSLDSIILLTERPDAVRPFVSAMQPRVPIEVHDCEPGSLGRARAAIAASRHFAPTCWRGGLGGILCHDEVFEPRATAEALERTGHDAAFILGPDWCALDPALCDAVIDRFREGDGALPLTFSQAPPGLAGCVVNAGLARKLADGRAAGDPAATLGALLSFHPLRPRRDPIAESCCVQIPAAIRSLHHRFIPDSPQGRAAVERALRRESESDETWLSAPSPSHLLIDVACERRRMALHDAARLFQEIAVINPTAAMTLMGRDPLLHAELASIVRAARDAGIAAIHVRTDALAGAAAIDNLLAAEPDVVSIDLVATSAETYGALTGVDRLNEALSNAQRLLDGRRWLGGLPRPWIVPRITRRDATSEEIEGFYDRALFFAHAGVIDPLPNPTSGDRITPLPKPRGTALRDAFSRLRVRVDGGVPLDEAADEHCAGNVLELGVAEAWRRVVEARRTLWLAGDLSHPHLRTLP